MGQEGRAVKGRNREGGREGEGKRIERGGGGKREMKSVRGEKERGNLT